MNDPRSSCSRGDPVRDGSELACAQRVCREYAPPENVSECVPTVRP